MSLTTTTSIMEYVKDFLNQAADEEWDHDFMIETWNEKEKDIKALVDANIPKKTKKESSPKDPNKPKRGKSAYIFYCADVRPAVKEDMGDVKPQEMMRELGARWRALKGSTKKSDIRKVEKYNKMAADDKVRAAEEMKTYVAPSDEELAAMVKPKRGRKSTKKKSDKPTKGRSAYIFYTKAIRDQVKEENPTADHKEITKLLSEMWKDVKDEDGEEYEQYKEMAAADKLRYEKEMETYVPSDDDEVEKKPKKRAKDQDDDIEKIGFKKFYNANREEVKEENPGVKPAGITKILKEEWGRMDTDEKRDWFEEEQEDDEE